MADPGVDSQSMLMQQMLMQMLQMPGGYRAQSSGRGMVNPYGSNMIGQLLLMMGMSDGYMAGFNPISSSDAVRSRDWYNVANQNVQSQWHRQVADNLRNAASTAGVNNAGMDQRIGEIAPIIAQLLPMLGYQTADSLSGRAGYTGAFNAPLGRAFANSYTRENLFGGITDSEYTVAGQTAIAAMQINAANADTSRDPNNRRIMLAGERAGLISELERRGQLRPAFTDRDIAGRFDSLMEGSDRGAYASSLSGMAKANFFKDAVSVDVAGTSTRMSRRSQYALEAGMAGNVELEEAFKQLEKAGDNIDEQIESLQKIQELLGDKSKSWNRDLAAGMTAGGVFAQTQTLERNVLSMTSAFAMSGKSNVSMAEMTALVDAVAGPNGGINDTNDWKEAEKLIRLGHIAGKSADETMEAVKITQGLLQNDFNRYGYGVGTIATQAVLGEMLGHTAYNTFGTSVNQQQTADVRMNFAMSNPLSEQTGYRMILSGLGKSFDAGKVSGYAGDDAQLASYMQKVAEHREGEITAQERQAFGRATAAQKQAMIANLTNGEMSRYMQQTILQDKESIEKYGVSHLDMENAKTQWGRNFATGRGSTEVSKRYRKNTGLVGSALVDVLARGDDIGGGSLLALLESDIQEDNDKAYDYLSRYAAAVNANPDMDRSSEEFGKEVQGAASDTQMGRALASRLKATKIGKGTFAANVAALGKTGDYEDDLRRDIERAADEGIGVGKNPLNAIIEAMAAPGSRGVSDLVNAGFGIKANPTTTVFTGEDSRELKKAEETFDDAQKKIKAGGVKWEDVSDDEMKAAIEYRETTKGMTDAKKKKYDEEHKGDANWQKQKDATAKLDRNQAAIDAVIKEQEAKWYTDDYKKLKTQEEKDAYLDNDPNRRTAYNQTLYLRGQYQMYANSGYAQTKLAEKEKANKEELDNSFKEWEVVNKQDAAKTFGKEVRSKDGKEILDEDGKSISKLSYAQAREKFMQDGYLDKNEREYIKKAGMEGYFKTAMAQSEAKDKEEGKDEKEMKIAVAHITIDKADTPMGKVGADVFGDGTFA